MITGALQAQPNPFAYVRNFLTDETRAHPQNWCITRDKEGFILAGNHAGILVFDGRQWVLHTPPQFYDIRSLHLNEKNGSILYGGDGEFGKFERDKKGNYHFVPFHSEQISKIGFTDVWKIHQIGDRIYFQSFAAIFEWHLGKFKVILPEKEFHLSFQIGAHLLVHEPSIGLKILQNDKTVLLEGGDYYKGDKIYSILQVSDNIIQIASRQHGLVNVRLESGRLEFLEKVKSPAFFPDDIYCGSILEDSVFAYGSLSKGLFLMNPDGTLIETYNKTNGLSNQSVKHIFQDKQKGIWLALESGISRIDQAFPIRFNSDEAGLNNTVQSISELGNTLYVATSQGVYFKSGKLNKNGVGGFEEVKGIKNQVFQLLKSNDGRLIACGVDGVFGIRDGEAKRIAPYRALSMAFAPWDSTLLLVGCFDGLTVLKNEIGNWKDIGYVNDESYEIRRMVFDASGYLWYSASDQGLIKLGRKSLMDFIHYGAQVKGKLYNPIKRSSTPLFIQPFYEMNKLLVGGEGAVFFYDSIRDALMPFEPDKFNNFLSQGQVYRIYEEQNRLWIYQYDGANTVFGFLDLKHLDKAFSNGMFSILKSKVIHDITSDSQGNILFGASDGLYYYNPKHRFPIDHYPAVLQEVIAAAKDTLVMNYSSSESNELKEIRYQDNSVSFNFSALFYSSSDLTKFSTCLRGFDTTFSAWSLENNRRYTNLPEGDYVFEVKALNIIGQESDVTRFAFRVLPPWYRTGWAYSGYVLGGILLLTASARISVYRLRQAKVKLEGIVKERTTEIIRQKEEIEAQKLMVELKNKDITDSITYARRIQQAILPVMDEIREALPSGFVLFLPRDIVSGDFFWFSGKYRINKQYVFLAAVDCTGHGVPGAFMSMIGNTLLNEIVNEKEILEPHLILEALHEGVRQALKQDHEDTATRDGMDIALIRLHIPSGQLLFSGANRPLWVIRKNGDFEDYKPDKKAIGGMQDENTRIFQQQSIMLAPGDRFFIFTDGYADQFGGSEGKKFMVKKLQQQLLAMANISTEQLGARLEELHLSWKGEHEQVDDILIMGFSLPGT
jgi:serine phosphatase RsbU (regulator of sigma subunit)